MPSGKRKSVKKSYKIATAVLVVACLGGSAAAAATAINGVSTPVTVSACLAGGKLSNVSVTKVPGCSASATPVSWPGNAVLPSPSPSPTSPSPSPTSPSPSPTSPSPSPTGSACVTSDPSGSCGAYDYPGIIGSNGYNTYVLNNMWGAGGTGATQTLTAYNPGLWSVVAKAPAGNGAVLTYPDTQQIFTRTDNTPDPLSGFTTLYSSFSENMHPASGTSAEAAYDIWAGQSTATNYADEIMIWNDQVNRSCAGGTPLLSGIMFGGSGGVLVQSWDLCSFGSSELIWSLHAGAAANEQTGTVDVLAMMNYLVSHKYLPAGTGLNQIDYGFEICSTGGVPETFSLSSYGITGG